MNPCSRCFLFSVIFFLSLPTIGISYRPIPKKYHAQVKKAVIAKDQNLCPKPEGKDERIYYVCKDKIIYDLAQVKSCNEFKGKPVSYAYCLGIVAQAKKDIDVCDSIKAETIKPYCVKGFHHYSTGSVDYILLHKPEGNKKNKLAPQGKVNEPKNPKGKVK